MKYVAWRIICPLVFGLGMFSSTTAQPAPTTDPQFDQGVQAYQQGAYDLAHARFQQVILAQPRSSHLTAALLMEGKTLYALKRFDEAREILQRLLDEHPESRYIADAQQTLQYADQWLDHQRQIEEGVFTLGVMLPMEGNVQGFSRSLFTGLRIAVEEHNERHPRRPIRMVFRTSRTGEGAVADVVRGLAMDDSVDVIIGPLMSEEATAAAIAAEQVHVPLLVPLATDDTVVGRRKYVFQANPSFATRGRLVARHAVRSLQYRRLGVLVQAGTFAEVQAEAFKEEVEALGAEILLYETLHGTGAWYNLRDRLEPDTLTYINALYVPITGERARSTIGTILQGLQLFPEVRILGNGEWHDVSNKAHASDHRTIYPLDFYVNEADPEVQRFIAAYKKYARREPDRPAFAGYDVAGYLAEHIATADPDEPLHQSLHRMRPYTGLASPIDFREGNINEAIHFMVYLDGQVRKR